MKKAIVGCILLLMAAACLPALAQGISEASGTVVDREGNPIKDAVVTFRAQSNPDVPYEATTNKKGRYFVAGMFSGKEDDLWIVDCAAAGLTPVEVRIESRTVNRVLVGDPMTTKLRPGKKPPEFPIRPLGKAKVDWTVAPAEEIEAQMEAEAVAAAQAAGASAEPAKNPWVEALTLASAGSLEESVALFQEAVEAEPDNAERHETFAKILYRVEQYDQAESEAQRAVEIEPGRVESYMVLFKVHDARGEFEQAKTVLAAARAAAPSDTRILMRQAYVATRLNDTEGAIAAYERVTEVNPDQAEAWLSLANLYAEAGRLEESEQAYRKVVEIDPEGAHQTYYNIGATIIKRKNRSDSDSKRAIEAFRKALELRPDYARAVQELAFALIGLGDKAGARSALQGFVDHNPDGADTPRMQSLLKTLGP